MTVSNQPADQIDHKVVHTAVPGMLDLRDVLELVEHGFDDGALTQQQFVGKWQQAVFHVGLEFGDQLQAEGVQQLAKQRLRDIAFVGEDLAEQVFDQCWDWAAVIGIAREVGS